MYLSSRTTGLAVLATVFNLLAMLYFLQVTPDVRVAMMQVSICFDFQLLICSAWLLAKLLLPAKPTATR
ncbi:MULTISPECIES: hypothetical protein [Cupriavidus]|uniref:Uncharacterized protein n=1 Tax=Cupriavidus oxalaticus TaxID=96344 RepID=A0A5P3VTR7_9BURK|nr:hypothetical protein [Cupriavidus oxalaticus]QEZ48832.1 hypothetical protein D2917_31670 [Cupriavidus oxalaticus]